MSKVVLQGYILVPDNELDIINQKLTNHTQLTLEEPGCITFKVIQNKSDACRFDVYEEFIDRAAFEHHQQRVAGSKWGKVNQKR